MEAMSGGEGGSGSIGAVLTRLRLARGFSQLRVAEMLCAASGMPTVSRHEVSRWERGQRIPGRFWLGWLALVLDAPLDELEAAAGAGRHPGRTATDRGLSRPPNAADLLTSLDRAHPTDVPALAHAWLVSPTGPAPAAPADATQPPGRPTLAAGGVGGRAGAAVDAVALNQWRRMDDLVGGADLAPRVEHALRTALAAAARQAGPGALRRAAAWAQLAGWVHADAGDGLRARRTWTVGLRAAAAAGDRPLAAHVLGSYSHLHAAAGDPHQALLLARTAYAGARHRASILCRALLLHRVALAGALAGERRTAQSALARAERVAERAHRDREPDWLYWLDQTELTAMTGRCLAALGRPLRATPLLTTVPARAGPRTSAVYRGWLARSYLALGEVEQACETATGAWVDAVRAGSARAAMGLRELHPMLLRHRDVPAVRGYQRLVAAAATYLPATPDRGIAARRSANARAR